MYGEKNFCQGKRSAKIDIIGNNFLAHTKPPRRKVFFGFVLCALAALREVSYFQ